MKRALCLVLCLLFAVPALAEEPAADARGIVRAAYARYAQNPAAFERFANEDVRQSAVYPTSGRAAGAMLSSCDFYDGYAGERGSAAKARSTLSVKALYATVYAMAMNARSGSERYSAPQSAWTSVTARCAWVLPLGALEAFGEETYAAAVMFYQNGQPADETVYLAVLGMGEEKSRLWLCGEADIAAPALAGLYAASGDAFAERDESAEANVRAFLESRADETPALLASLLEGGAAAREPASPRFQIGAVRITRSDTNLREAPDAGAALIAKLRKGVTLVCVSHTANGWYEVEYEDGTLGFVAGKMVDFIASEP